MFGKLGEISSFIKDGGSMKKIMLAMGRLEQYCQENGRNIDDMMRDLKKRTLNDDDTNKILEIFNGCVTKESINMVNKMPIRDVFSQLVDGDLTDAPIMQVIADKIHTSIDDMLDMSAAKFSELFQKETGEDYMSFIQRYIKD